MIVMSLCLDRGKVREVEEMLLMIENDGNNDEILAGLTSLEEYMDPDMNLDMTLQEEYCLALSSISSSIGWPTV